MTSITFRATRFARVIHTALAAAPLHRGRILRGCAASARVTLAQRR